MKRLDNPCSSGCNFCANQKPSEYWIEYVVRGYVGMGCSDTVKKRAKLPAKNDEQAKLQFEEWKKEQKKKEDLHYKVVASRLVEVRVLT